MNDNLKPVIRKYLFTILPAIAASALILLINNFGAAEGLQERYRLLANAFTTPGIILIMMGILVLVSREGTFDMLGYGVTKAFYRFSQRSDRAFESFYDYKQRQIKKERGSILHLFVVGAVFTLVATVFTVLYHTV
jgi:hypothetical protein